MKYKLILDSGLLKQPYQQTLSRSLLICPQNSESTWTVKDLLKFAYESFQFAFEEIIRPQDLYLCTEDDFLLPPNCKISLALDPLQVIRLKKVALNVEKHTPNLFGMKQKSEIQPAVQEEEKKKPNNRRKINKKQKSLCKRTILELSSESSSSSSSEKSSSESSSESSEEEKPPVVKRSVKNGGSQQQEKKREQKHKSKIDVNSMKDKIKNQFDKAFQKASVDSNQSKTQAKAVLLKHNPVIQPKVIAPPPALNKAKVIAPPQQKIKNDQKLDQLKKQSKELERPYLNQFDHLLKSKQPPTTEALYDELFGDNQKIEEDFVDDGYYDEEASPSEVRRNKKFKHEEDTGFYNKYTQVYNKNSKKQQQMTESIFNSGGLLEILNQKNLLIILNLENYVYLSPEVLQKIKLDQLLPYLPENTEVCFRITEPSLETFIPKVSEPKIGNVVSCISENINIQLRNDFLISDEEQDQQLMMVFPDGKYMGEGFYKLTLSEIVGMYIKVVDANIRQQLQQIATSFNPQAEAQPEVAATNDNEKNNTQLAKTASKNSKKGLADFMNSSSENIDKAIKRQVEYYFSDVNYPKDKYLQNKASKNPEGFISLKEIMAFNKLKQLTKSADAVIKALEGSTQVEFSEDGKQIRKRQPAPVAEKDAEE